MRMSYSSLGHQSPEDLEFREWEDWMVLRHPNCPELDGVLCWEKIPGPGKTRWSPCTSTGTCQSWRPVGSGPGHALGVGLEGLGRDPTGWGQEGERDGCRDFFSVVLYSVCPQRLFFPSFAKHFSEMGNNLNV